VATSSPLPAPSYAPIKFQKEDVEAVMTELPTYNFYEMNESVPNPYASTTLDRSILLDPPMPAPVKPTVSFAKLENGLKIASVDNGGLKASLGLFVNAGSRFETSANFGVSHMISLMAFKSTAHLSHLRTVKTLEQLGASCSSSCTAGREEMLYQVEVMREYVPLVVPLMVGNVLFPRLLPWEVKASHSKVKEARAALEANPDAMVSELLHKAAYCNNSLGLSTLASDRSMPYFDPETMRSFLLDHFAPENMVLVGVNVSEGELSKWAMRSFVDYNAIPLKKRTAAKANYTGGDARAEGSSPFCHLAISLESVPWGQAELAPVAILQSLLGSGSAVSSSIGGGSSSRLAQVVKQNPYVESCSAFNTSYSDSGLFGVYGVCQPDKAGDLCSAITKALAGLKTISTDELNAAKTMLKGRMLRQVDDDATFMKDMGQQLLLSGRYGSPSDFAKLIDATTADQVAAAASKMLSSRPTVAAFGDTHAVPHYGAVEAGLK
jgi:processing peptidase subunit alpha